MDSFAASYPNFDLIDSHTDAVWTGPMFIEPLEGTLDGYLLDNWQDGRAVYDSLFVNSWGNTSKVTPPYGHGIIMCRS